MSADYVCVPEPGARILVEGRCGTTVFSKHLRVPGVSRWWSCPVLVVRMDDTTRLEVFEHLEDLSEDWRDSTGKILTLAESFGPTIDWTLKAASVPLYKADENGPVVVTNEDGTTVEGFELAITGDYDCSIIELKRDGITYTAGAYKETPAYVDEAGHFRRADGTPYQGRLADLTWTQFKDGDIPGVTRTFRFERVGGAS